MIVATHMFMIPELSVPSGAASFAYWKVRNLGWSGVDLFLVLLGFFMAASLFRDLERRNTIALFAYWGRRAKRIVPSYYLLLVVLACTGATGFVKTTDLQSFASSILVHVLFLQNYVKDSGNGPTWFLGVAIHLYVLLPLMMIALLHIAGDRWKQAFPLLAIAMILLPFSMRCFWCVTGRLEAGDYYFTHFRADTVFVGMLSQYILRYCPSVAEHIRSRPKTLMLIALALIAPCLQYSRGNPFMFTVGFTLLAIGYALLTMLAAEGAFAKTRGALSPFKAVGDWSYNIYLWHFFLPALLGFPFAKMNLWLSQLPLGYLVQITLFFLVAIAVGYGVTVCFERPVSRLLSHPRASALSAVKKVEV